MSEEQGDYVTDALEMMGRGYDQRPTVSVEPPRKYVTRREGKMVEVEEPAWVKFSTDFKAELADLDEHALKVFIYIGLSIGFETGTAWPGIRKIAHDCRMNKDTALKAVAELEAKGFLAVARRDGTSNEYKPMRYFAIGRLSDETGHPELSGADAELSEENAELSDARPVKMHNQNNKKKQEKSEEEGRGATQNVFTVYEHEIGVLTPHIADELTAAEEEHGPQWVCEALKVASANGKRNWAYARAVLARWKAEGSYGSEKKNGAKHGSDQQSDTQYTDEERATAAAIRAQRAGLP